MVVVKIGAICNFLDGICKNVFVKMVVFLTKISANTGL